MRKLIVTVVILMVLALFGLILTAILMTDTNVGRDFTAALEDIIEDMPDDDGNDPEPTDGHLVGSYGARLPLPAGWRPRVMDRMISGHQFMDRDETCGLVVSEVVEPLVTPADFEAAMADAVTSGLGKSTQLKATTTDGVIHRAREYTSTIDGTRFLYCIHVLGKDGLNFTFHAWTVPSNRRTLMRDLDRMMRSFHWPEPEQWKNGGLTTATVAEVNHQFTITHPTPPFQTDPDLGDAFHSMTSGSGNSSVYFFLCETYSPDREFDSEKEVLESGYGELEEVERSELVAGDWRCPQRVYRRPGDPGEIHIVVTMFPVGEGIWGVMRYITAYDVAGQMDYIRQIMEGLTVAETEDLGAFPTAVAASEPTRLSPAMAALFADAERLGGFDNDGHAFELTPDGDVIGRGGREVQLLKQGETEGRSLHSFSRWNSKVSVVPRGDDLWVTSPDSPVVIKKDDGSEETTIDADHLTALPDGDLLLARTKEAAASPYELLGKSDQATEPPRLIRRTADGTETEVAVLRAELRLIKSDTGGNHVLVVAERPWSESWKSDELAVSIYDTTTWKATPVAGWKGLGSVAPTADGWLVRGTPKDKRVGLYHLTADGSHTLLVSGSELAGVGLADDMLTVAVDRSLSADATDDISTHIWRIPMSAVKAHGPAVAPLSPEAFQQVAEQVVTELELPRPLAQHFANRDRIAEVVAAARRIGKQQHGAALSIEPAELDELLDDLSLSDGLGHESVFLAAALLAEALLEQGARWVEAPSTGDASWSGTYGYDEQNPFAYIVDPLQIIRQVFFDSEGWYSPLESIADAREGRIMLVGFDRNALIDAGRTLADPDLTKILAAKQAAPAIELLEKHRDNVYLRRLVFRHAETHLPEAEWFQLFKHFGTHEAAAEVDTMFWLLARLDNLAKDDAAAWIEECQAMIAKAPDEGLYYYLLGRGYEAAGADGSLAKARICYNEAVDLSWDAVADKATERLDAISEDTN